MPLLVCACGAATYRNLHQQSELALSNYGLQGDSSSVIPLSLGMHYSLSSSKSVQARSKSMQVTKGHLEGGTSCFPKVIEQRLSSGCEISMVEHFRPYPVIGRLIVQSWSFCLCTTQVRQPQVSDTLTFPHCSGYGWRIFVAVVKIATTTLCRWFLRLTTSALIDRP